MNSEMPARSRSTAYAAEFEHASAEIQQITLRISAAAESACVPIVILFFYNTQRIKHIALWNSLARRSRQRFGMSIAFHQGVDFKATYDSRR
jgi:hypothetical protein